MKKRKQKKGPESLSPGLKWKTQSRGDDQSIPRMHCNFLPAPRGRTPLNPALSAPFPASRLKGAGLKTRRPGRPAQRGRGHE